MDERGKTRLTIKTWRKGFHKRRLFTIFSPQTFTMAVANVYDGGCKRLRERMQTFAVKRGSALQGRMQCTAGTVAVHCGDGCSALRERLQCTASEMGKTGTEIASPILDKRTERRDAPVAPWKYLLNQKEGKSRHCSVIHL